MEEYNINLDFKEYVDKYCRKHKIIPEQAVEHELVRTVETDYRYKRQNKSFDNIGDAIMFAQMMEG